MAGKRDNDSTEERFTDPIFVGIVRDKYARIKGNPSKKKLESEKKMIEAEKRFEETGIFSFEDEHKE